MARRTQPNIILILCDDLGYGDVGVLFQNQRRSSTPGTPSLRTPHLDAMADEGLVLSGMYCPAPVCAPSRASLLTGTSQGHVDLRDNAFDRELEDTFTLASVLRQAGYATSAVGKWGMQGSPVGPEAGEVDDQDPDCWPGYPTKRGFDEFFGYVRHRDGHEHYPKEGLHRGPKQVWHDDREVSGDLDGCYTTDLFTARAKDWIDRHVSAEPEKPFFVYLAYDTPHAVLELAPCAFPAGGGRHGGLRWLGEPGAMINTAAGEPDSYYHPDYASARSRTETGDQDWPDVYKRYASSVRRIDDCVGDLLELLTDLDIDDETLVIFTSDNGPSVESYLTESIRTDFFQSSGPFDGIKRDCWEGGVRVGALVRAPGLVPAGRTSTHPTQFHDLLPTFAELAGLTPPARTDGVSLVPLLTEEGDQLPSRVYVEYAVGSRTPDYPSFAPARRDRMRGQMQVLRRQDHVGVRYDIQDHADPFEIYDVIADPQQRHDLGPDRPDLQESFRAETLRMRVPHPTVARPYDEELIPALGSVASDPPTRPGPTSLATFTGSYPWVPLLDGLEPVTTTAVEKPGTGEQIPTGSTALLYTGLLDVPIDGAYSFEVISHHGAVLRLHQALAVDCPTVAGQDQDVVVGRGSLRLQAGQHPFRLSVLGSEPPTFTWQPGPLAEGGGQPGTTDV